MKPVVEFHIDRLKDRTAYSLSMTALRALPWGIQIDFGIPAIHGSAACTGRGVAFGERYKQQARRNTRGSRIPYLPHSLRHVRTVSDGTEGFEPGEGKPLTFFSSSGFEVTHVTSF